MTLRFRGFNDYSKRTSRLVNALEQEHLGWVGPSCASLHNMYLRILFAYFELDEVTGGVGAGENC
jgi:hypothetical protein